MILVQVGLPNVREVCIRAAFCMLSNAVRRKSIVWAHPLSFSPPLFELLSQVCFTVGIGPDVSSADTVVDEVSPCDRNGTADDKFHDVVDDAWRGQ